MSNYCYQVIPDPKYGYFRVDPLPTPEELSLFYLEEFYSTIPPERNDSALVSQDETFNKLRFDLLRAKIEEVHGTLSGLRLLDIGCGYCQALLYFLESGLKVRGVDPALESVTYGRARGLDVRQVSVEDKAALTVGGPFDIVLLLNVLEHLRDPASLLKGLRESVIDPRGLLIVDVPNEFNELQMTADEEFGLNQWWVTPPYHINYFSRDSLCSLLSHCKYEIVGTESSFPMELFLLMGDVYVGNSDLGRSCHLKRIHFEETLVRHGRLDTLRRFYEALAGCGLGRQITVYARPLFR